MAGLHISWVRDALIHAFEQEMAARFRVFTMPGTHESHFRNAMVELKADFERAEAIIEEVFGE